MVSKEEARDHRSYLFHGGRLFDLGCDALIEDVEVQSKGDRVKQAAPWHSGVLPAKRHIRETRHCRLKQKERTVLSE